MEGLTTTEARKRLAEHGPNALPSPERRTAAQHALALMREPMLLLLLAAAALYVVFGDLAEALALGVSMLAIVAITLFQQRRTERALDALRELSTPHARVRRDGEWKRVDARDVVHGDVIHVGEGDRIAADATLRAGGPVAVDESLLTGESVPVLRPVGGSVFAGTLVGSGHGVAEVHATGPRTEVGKIGAALSTIELAEAPLYREVGRVVKRIAIVAIGFCVALAAIYLAAGHGVLAAGLAGITLAMSLLPEELPLVLTIFLTIGAWRIARHKVLARRAAAIETLGSVTVLCVDKTGTLTQNRMAIRRVVTAATTHDIDSDPAALPDDVHETIEVGVLACPDHPQDPMDRAFTVLGERALADTEHVHPSWRRVHEYPLTAEMLAVTHVWADDKTGSMVVATKGAPEAIMDLCHLDAATADVWRERAEAMAADGLRVLGVARGVLADGGPPLRAHDATFELVGLVGLADPLRPETPAAIAACREAGIRVVMITGDHPVTARAIARAAGLPESDVIARARPADKLRIIQELQARGEIVGMTGDGVNDAPALKAADVGIAMGRGTDVAREAAGLVLLDDSLAALTAAIRTGRTIYDNLREVARYLIAVHVPIVTLSLLPPLLGWPLLLGPVHIVLLELVMDPTCSVVFELERPRADVMNRPPRPRGVHLFDARGVVGAILLGFAAVVGPLALAAFGVHDGSSPERVRTVAFIALAAANIALVVALTRDNPAFKWVVAGVSLVLAAVLAMDWSRQLFGFGWVGLRDVAIAIIAGAGPVLALGRAGRARARARILQHPPVASRRSEAARSGLFPSAMLKEIDVDGRRS